MEENLKLIGDAATFCYEDHTVKSFIQNPVIVQSQPGRRPVIKTQAILHSAYRCVKRFTRIVMW
jgi:hypothetical protein